ncbi:hypothetical protein BJX61DRAFT_530777 [Aspergillus egyptiacus]|nr:hypothetical protein BJX61DRAFT_530777 [Aspergillus egyptiacus]
MALPNPLPLHTIHTHTHTHTLNCIDMHTTGQPTRIIHSGFPALQGATLLDKRDDAAAHHDTLRRRLMLEPRGHAEMYGAILVHETERVAAGEADIGVLFVHAGGFSTMCGHATLALGRVCVDLGLGFSIPEMQVGRAKQQEGEPEEREVRIHAPCGVVRLLRVRSDPARAVSFLSTPGYVAGLGIEVEIPEDVQWAELGGRRKVTVDISYGGAFYAMVDVRELGFAFERGLSMDHMAGDGAFSVEMKAMAAAARRLKRYLSSHPAVVAAMRNRAEDERLAFLYGVMVVDSRSEGGYRPEGVEGAETGVCFFGESDQVDRSPTGSCVTARVALAYAKGSREVGQRWAYNSLVSRHFRTGAFVGSIVETGVPVRGYLGESWPGVIVRVEGNAYYTGTSTFIHEEGDITSDGGFRLDL